MARAEAVALMAVSGVVMAEGGRGSENRKRNTTR
jgi:hypothetical protein